MFQCIAQPRHLWDAVDDTYCNTDIKSQLSDQTRVLESRAETSAGISLEFYEFCRRRAELELEYSRALEKLVKSTKQRHKEQRHKREEWNLTGAYACWIAMLENTSVLARDHAVLAEIYGVRLAVRIQRAADDAMRLYRKCKDIVNDRIEEVGASLVEVGTSGKTFSASASEWRATAHKLKFTYDQMQRIVSADPPRPKKIKTMNKELEKRRNRHVESRVKSMRSRSDYMLCLESANATVTRYFLDDIVDILFCMEVGFEACVGRVLRTAVVADKARAESLISAADTLLGTVENMDCSKERQQFMEAHSQVFTPPRQIPFQGTPPDQEEEEIAQTLGDAADPVDEAALKVADEMAARLIQLEANVRALRAECKENAKTLDAAETELVQQMEGPDEYWDVSRLFGANAHSERAGTSSGSTTPGTALVADDQGIFNDAARKEQEDYYLEKFRSYINSAGRLTRLEAKASLLRGRIIPSLAPDKVPPTPPPDSTTDSFTPYLRYRRRGANGRGQFAAPLEEHLAITKRDLPIVVTSCVRVIATYGKRHQGIFRVSGSQVEMQGLRAAFDRGEDPLASVQDATDINSVAGLLKLYLRELRPPLLASNLMDKLTRIAALQLDHDFIKRMHDLVNGLPKSAFLLLRFLFAFFNHLTEYSEYNMMDPWNLAICVGPTLMAAGGEGGGAQVTAQNLINELVKRLIEHHLLVFRQNIVTNALYCKDNYIDPEEDQQNEEEKRQSASAIYEAETKKSDAEELDINDMALFELKDEHDATIEDTEWLLRESPREKRCVSVDRCPQSPVICQVRDVPSTPPPPPERVSSAMSSPALRLAEATPDLVLDLPLKDPVSGEVIPTTDTPCITTDTNEPTDTADTFLHNRDTLKKRPKSKQATTSENDGDDSLQLVDPDLEDVFLETTPPSPVPARNTARVAAKFADLTLTGGSLKPAVAVKPALMRRPTPHPHHAHTSKQDPNV